MKICPDCGKTNKDTAKFCTGCGNNIEEVSIIPGEPDPEPAPAPSPVFAPEPDPAPAAAQPVAARPAVPAVARTPAQARLKEIASSKLALVVCIAFTLVVLCAMCTSVFLPKSLGNYAQELQGMLENLKASDLNSLFGGNIDISQADLDEALDSFNDAFNGTVEFGVKHSGSVVGRFFGAITSHAVEILFAVSLWIIYGVAKKEDSVCCGTTGLKIIRVLRTIGLVLAVILAVLFAVALAFALFMSVREGYNEATTALYVGLGFTAVVFLIVFCFLGGCVRTLKSYISVSENTPGKTRISGFVRFILFVGGIFSVIGALGWILAVFTTGADLVIFALSAAATAVYQFALSSFIGRSKKALKTV